MKSTNYIFKLSLRYLSFNLVFTNCSCNEYVNADGYGNCQKTIGGKGLACYVNQPSTCQDLVNSATDNGKQYSWEACMQGHGKKCTTASILWNLH